MRTVPLKRTALDRAPFLTIGDGVILLHLRGLREPWSIRAEGVRATPPDRWDGTWFVNEAPLRAMPNLRLAFPRPVPAPRLTWWAAFGAPGTPDHRAIDLRVRDLPSAIAALAAEGVPWSDEP